MPKPSRQTRPRSLSALPPPSQAFHAALIRVGAIVEKATSVVHGDDIFISYAHRDATKYATGLANALVSDDFVCRVDQWASEPDRKLPRSLVRALRACRLMVVVGSKSALRSRPMGEEIREFRKTRRPIVSIDCCGSIRKARWWGLVAGPPREIEDEAAFKAGVPSPAVIDRIVKSCTFVKKDRRLRRIARWVGVATLVLVVIALAAAWLAADAESQRERAEELRSVAESLAEDAESRRKQAEESLSITQSRNLGVRARLLAAEGRELEALRSGASAVASVAAKGREPHPDARFGLWSALDAITRSLPLEGHSARVTAAAFLRQGTQVVTGDEAGVIRFWDTDSGELLYTIEHGGEVRQLAVRHRAHDDERPAAASDDLILAAGPDLLLRWDGSQPENVPFSKTYEGYIWSATISPAADEVVITDSSCDDAYVLGADRTVELEDHDASVLQAVYSQDGRRIVTRDERSVIRVFDARSLELLDRYGANAGWEGLKLSPYSDHFFARLRGEPWIGQVMSRSSMESGSDRFVRKLAKDDLGENPRALAFSPCGELMAVADEQAVRVFVLLTGKVLCELVGLDPGRVEQVAFGPERLHHRLLTVEGFPGRRARLWEVTRGRSEEAQPSLQRHDGVLHAAFSPDGDRVVTTSGDGSSRIWRLDGAADSQLISRKGDSVVFDQGSDGMVEARTAYDRRLLLTLKDQSKPAHAALSPDGKLVATASGRTVRVLSLATSTEAGPPCEHEADVSSLVWLVDSRSLATVTADNKTHFWNVDTGVETHSGAHDAEIRVRSARSSPDGDRFVTVGDGQVELRRSSDGHLIHSFEADGRDRFTEAELSPDGSVIATGSSEGLLDLRDAESGERLYSSPAHRGYIADLSFDPTGDLLVTVGAGTARIWSVADGAFEFELGGHSGIDFGAFALGGDRLVTSSRDRSSTRIYDISPDGLLRSAVKYLEHRESWWGSLDEATRELLSSGRAGSEDRLEQ